MCFYMCGHSCVGTHVHVGASVWRPKVGVGNLPQLLFHFILLRQGLSLNLELTTPSKSLASLLQGPLPPPSEAGVAGWSPCPPGIHGVQASELPSSCLHVRTSAAKPSSHPCTFYLRENLPTQFTKPENQEPSPAVHSRGRF